VRLPEGGTGTGVHFCRIPVPFLKCPTQPENHADKKQEIYQDPYQNPGITNYVCIPGTHLKTGGGIQENGVIVSKAENRLGLTLDDIVDGTSKTLLVAESREVNYASWYDGQVTWVTAILPQYTADFENTPADAQDDDGDGVPDKIRTEGWETALNSGPPTATSTDNAYWTTAPFDVDTTYGGRRWGPSSMHRGGVVLHVFADQHTTTVNEDIDTDVYYALCTRDGSESVSLEAVIKD
jgi:hypothetical protein